MTHPLIGQHCTSQIAYHLMHLDQDLRGRLAVESDRLHVRVDLGPLLAPVSADRFMTADETTFERPRPRHVRARAASISRALKAA